MNKEVLQETGILLEGGAMRSVYTAGILDYLLEKQIHVPNVIGVSAGAYAGMNYLSRQKGRVRETNIEYMKEEKYIGLATFLRTGNLFDMDLLFDRLPNVINPFDFECFSQKGKKFMISTTDCSSGRVVYYSQFEDRKRLFEICRAANSLPLIAKVNWIDGLPMLDGGMADAIPIVKALEEGWKKIIVILTRDESYRKKKSSLYVKAIQYAYRKYPAFCGMIERRYQMYNDALEKIAELEKSGKAFVFRPAGMKVKNNETNVKKLTKYYQFGYDNAEQRFNNLFEFMEKG